MNVPDQPASRATEDTISVEDRHCPHKVSDTMNRNDTTMARTDKTQQAASKFTVMSQNAAGRPVTARKLAINPFAVTRFTLSVRLLTCPYSQPEMVHAT